MPKRNGEPTKGERRAARKAAQPSRRERLQAMRDYQGPGRALPKHPKRNGKRTALRRSRELEDRILSDLAAGASLRRVLGDHRHPDYPDRPTFHEWLRADSASGRAEEPDSLAARYARARQERMDAIAEDLLEIGDGTLPTTIVDETGVRRELISFDEQVRVARDRLRVDTRKFYLSKLGGSQYADRVEVDLHAGETLRSKLAELAARLAGTPEPGSAAELEASAR